MVVTLDYTQVNPLALLILLAVAVIVLVRDRQTATLALLFAALVIPLGQQFMVFGLHIRFFRLLILVGFLRLMVRGELRATRLNTIDRLMIACSLTGVICGIIRGPKAETFGVAYDALGTYFLFRFLITDLEQVVGQLRMYVVIALVLAAAMSVELSTHHNPFYVFGGVPEMTYIREGRFRCQGPFRHPILGGTFAASLSPLLAGLWLQQPKGRWRTALGLAACAFCSYAAASSGAMLTLLGGAVGCALWVVRKQLRMLRWATVGAVAVLAVAMNAPVWYLIARISDLTGGTGWHRSFLIDLAVKNFGDWWLVGFGRTLEWAPANWIGAPGTSIDADNLDITNHYLQQGLHGGLLQLGLFIAILVLCFRAVGRAVRLPVALVLERKTLWTLGAGLAAHCMAFISVSYFDQIQVFWFWLIAVLSLLSTTVAQAEAAVAQGAFEIPAESDPEPTPYPAANPYSFSEQTPISGASQT